MYNRIYKTIYLKQFGFQFGHLTDHAIIQFVNLKVLKITCIPWVCLSTFQKDFDTVDHRIVLKKLELYGIRDNNHNWIKSFLSNRK